MNLGAFADVFSSMPRHRLRSAPPLLAAVAALAGCASTPAERALQVRDEHEAALRGRAEAGDVEAMTDLVESLLGRWLSPPPYFGGQVAHWPPTPPTVRWAEAGEWLERATRRGGARALRCAAWVAENDLDLPEERRNWRSAGEPTSSSRALAWYRRAAATGDAESALALGVHLSRWFDGPADAEDAARWLRRAARSGLEVARWELLWHLRDKPGARRPGDLDLLPLHPWKPAPGEQGEPTMVFAPAAAWAPSSQVVGLAPYVPHAPSQAELARESALPGSARALAADAARALADGRLNDAEAAAVDALALDRGQPLAHVVLAARDLRHAAAGATLNEALLLSTSLRLSQAVDNEPCDPELRAALAVCEAWERAGECAANSPGSSAQAAVWLAQTAPSEVALALEAWGSLEVLDEHAGARVAHHVAEQLASRAQLRADPADREADYDQALALEPDLDGALPSRFSLRDPRVERARLRAQRGDLEGAALDLSYAVEWRPHRKGVDRAGPLRLRAHVRARLGELDRATSDLDAALALDPHDVHARTLRGLVALASGVRPASLDDLERAQADRWLAAIGADPRRQWLRRLEPRLRRLTEADISPADARSLLDGAASSVAPYGTEADTRPATATCLAGVVADRCGDRAAARALYAERIARAGGLDDLELTWALLRQRQLLE